MYFGKMKKKEAFCPFVILRRPFPSLPHNPFTSFWKTFDALINENTKKEGENGNPNMSSVRLYGKIMSTMRKRYKRWESRHRTTQGDDDPGDSML